MGKGLFTESAAGVRQKKKTRGVRAALFNHRNPSKNRKVGKEKGEYAQGGCGV